MSGRHVESSRKVERVRAAKCKMQKRSQRGNTCITDSQLSPRDPVLRRVRRGREGFEILEVGKQIVMIYNNVHSTILSLSRFV